MRNALLLLFALFTHTAMAGIMPASSRVIYPSGDREKTLMLVNTNDYPVVVQSWVDNGEGSPDTAAVPFVVLPPVFRLAAGGIQGLRIVYNHDPLPQDRESAFWLNLYEMPPESTNNAPSHLTLAMNTQLKIFFRPQAVTLTPGEAIHKLTYRLGSDGKAAYIEFTNPTPLHISFSAIRVGSTKVNQESDMMIKPFSQRRYWLAENVASGNVTATCLGDNGELLEIAFQK